jgi:hypothetical protein
MPLVPDAAKIQKSLAMLPVSRYEPGEMVIAAGTTTGKLLLLRQGLVEVVRDGTQIARISEPGSIFGELAILLDKPHTADVRAVERSEFHVADAAALLATDPAATLYIAAILSPPRTKCTLGNSPRHGTWSVRRKLVCCGCGTRGSYPQLVFSNAGEPPTIGRSAQTSLLSIQKLHPDLQDKSLDHSSRLSSR